MGATNGTNPCRWAIVVFIIFPTAGCARESSPADSFTIRDSAGIEIVRTERPIWGETEAWRLSEAPVLDIGTVDGPSVYQLHNVLRAVRMSDGRIVIANRGTREVRFFSKNGTHLVSYGGEGEGPGLFLDINWLGATRANTVFAYDARRSRLTILTPQGTLDRIVTMQREGALSYVVGLDADGSFVSLQPWLDTDPAQLVPGNRRLQGAFVFHTPTGAIVDTIGPFPTFEQQVSLPPSGPVIEFAPFGLGISAVVGADGLYVGTQSDFSIGVYSRDGLQRIVRSTISPTPVGREDVELYKGERLQTSNDPRLGERLDALQFPAAFPAYDALIVDASEHLWVQQYHEPSREGPNRWVVFDARGVMLGTVRTPEQFGVYEIGSDYVLGLGRDALDVEHVRMYRLLRVPVE